MNAPCLDCPDRSPGCHDESSCEKWASFQKKIGQIKEADRANRLVADYVGRSIFRRRREKSQAIRRALSQR